MIDIKINTQPNDETCGATCLHAIYRHYGLDISIEQVISGLRLSLSGGTLATLVGRHALEQGFKVTVYTNNLYVVDPSWFDVHGESDGSLLSAKLEEQLKYKDDKHIVSVSESCLEYFKLGGKMCFKTLDAQLLNSFFKRNIPIMTGLSATYLYRCPRELYTEEGVAVYDDVRGTPCGHFVILCGYDEEKKHVVVADPHRENPLAHNNYYYVDIHRLINAIMLGVITSDGTLVIIEP
jgi:Peptidase C39 family